MSDYIDGWNAALFAVEDLIYCQPVNPEEALRLCYEHMREKLLPWRQSGSPGNPPELERTRMECVSPEALSAPIPDEK